MCKFLTDDCHLDLDTVYEEEYCLNNSSGLTDNENKLKEKVFEFVEKISNLPDSEINKCTTCQYDLCQQQCWDWDEEIQHDD